MSSVKLMYTSIGLMCVYMTATENIAFSVVIVAMLMMIT